MSSGVASMKSSMALPANARKNPVTRPVRHLGPPPGFSPVPSRVSDESLSRISIKKETMQQDDYSWLDGYNSQSAKGIGFNNFINQSAQSHLIACESSVTGMMAFPFPGKQVPVALGHAESQRKWQEYNIPDRYKIYQEQLQQKQVQKIKQQSIQVPIQNQAHSLWDSRFFM